MRCRERGRQRAPLKGPVHRARGATWGPDGTIVFSAGPDSPLMKIADSGGQPTPLTTLDKEKGEKSHRWPQWLPGDEAVLFSSTAEAAASFEDGAIEVVLVATGDVVLVFRDGMAFDAVSGQEWVFEVAEFEREVEAYRKSIETPVPTVRKVRRSDSDPLFQRTSS